MCTRHFPPHRFDPLLAAVRCVSFSAWISRLLPLKVDEKLDWVDPFGSPRLAGKLEI